MKTSVSRHIIFRFLGGGGVVGKFQINGFRKNGKNIRYEEFKNSKYIFT
jgi:hypothetical protein